MKDIIVWAIHTPSGSLALMSAITAMFAKKGSMLHGKSGTWFSISMMVMLVSGIAAAYLKDSVGDVMLGAIVMYTVFTAWLTVHHKNSETSILEVIALIWIIGFGLAALSISMGWREVDVPLAYLGWLGLATLCIFGDIRNLYHSGLVGTQRIIRHVWRIGFSLLWAALAFTDKIVKMMGTDLNDMRDDQIYLIIAIVAIPTIVILTTILYWIANILFFSREKFTRFGESTL